MRVAYIVSRFPTVSETFIVRELDTVAADPAIDIELLALFPAPDVPVHPRARPWVGRLRRAGAVESVVGTAWWLVRRPGTFARVVAGVVRGYGRRPGLLVRAVVTVAVAAAHARALRGLNVDRVHAHFATYPALAAWVVRRLTGIPYSFTAHAHDLFVDQSMLAEKLAAADFCIAISHFNREFLDEYGGRSATHVEVVRCGIEIERYRLGERTGHTPPIALCVASMKEYKGHRYLLEALALPGLEQLELELLGDGELRGELEHLASALGISNRVHFRGSATEDAVADALHDADIFVLPSVVARDGQMEGLPVALMEAMAAGVPVVATRLSGIPELVRDGETGLLADPADPGSLAGALAAVLADPEAARDRAAAGRKLVEAEFDLAQTARRITDLLLDAPGQTSRLGAAPEAPVAERR